MFHWSSETAAKCSVCNHSGFFLGSDKQVAGNRNTDASLFSSSFSLIVGKYWNQTSEKYVQHTCKCDSFLWINSSKGEVPVLAGVCLHQRMTQRILSIQMVNLTQQRTASTFPQSTPPNNVLMSDFTESVFCCLASCRSGALKKELKLEQVNNMTFRMWKVSNPNVEKSKRHLQWPFFPHLTHYFQWNLSCGKMIQYFYHLWKPEHTKHPDGSKYWWLKSPDQPDPWII